MDITFEKVVFPIAIVVILFICTYGVYSYFYPDSYKYSWRCDRWHFNGTESTRLISGTSDLAEGDILAIQYYCANLPPTSQYEGCQLLYSTDGSRWGFDYRLRNGTNGTTMIDREKDCVEWVSVKTKAL